MFLGYRMKKHCKGAYDRVTVPELNVFQFIAEEQPPSASKTKCQIKNVLRAAACIVLAFILIGVVMPRNYDNTTGEANTFVLTAYAASETGNPITENNFSIGLQRYGMSAGITMVQNSEIMLPVQKFYIAKDAAGNNYGSNIDDFSIFEGCNIVEGSQHAEYSCGFKFSGDSIDSVTMTSLNGRFTAYDYSVVNPIYQKYAKIVDKGNGFSTCVIDDKEFSDSDKEFMNSHIKNGQTVTFTSAGYTANWGYAIDNNKKTSDTIEITINYSDGSTQHSVLLISEDDNGNIVAVLD